MKNIPKKIWLQIGDEDDVIGLDEDNFNERAEITWAENKIFDSDIEYHLATNGKTDLITIDTLIDKWERRQMNDDLEGFEWRMIQEMIADLKGLIGR